MTSGPKELVKVRLAGLRIERVWARDLGNDQYQIKNTPFFTNNVSFDDKVLAPAIANEVPIVTKVIAKSGYKTVRILMPDTSLARETSALLAELEATEPMHRELQEQLQILWGAPRPAAAPLLRGAPAPRNAPRKSPFS